jgi:hypothetical protein
MPKQKKSRASEELTTPTEKLAYASTADELLAFRGEIDDLKSQLKRLKRRKKDGGGTQQPINPYMFWSNVYQGGERKKVVAENGGHLNQTTNPGGISVSQAAKLLGERWRGLPSAARDTFKVLRDDYIRERGATDAAPLAE